MRRFLSSLKHNGQPRVGTILPACHRADGNARHPPVVEKTPLASAASESLHSVVSVYNRPAGPDWMCVFFKAVSGGERKCFRRDAHNKACELSCVTELWYLGRKKHCRHVLSKYCFGVSRTAKQVQSCSIIFENRQGDPRPIFPKRGDSHQNNLKS